MIFLRAFPAHGELLHARALSVIGERIQYSHARAAACTIYKGMQITSVCLIEKLPPAIITHSDIRGNIYSTPCPFAFDYGKILIFRNKTGIVNAALAIA